MTIHGHVRNGAIVIDSSVVLPEGAAVRVEVVADPLPTPAVRVGGQYKGQVWMAPDFDDWPEDMHEALGMK